MKRSRSRRRHAYKDLVRQRMQILYEEAIKAVEEGDWGTAEEIGSILWGFHVETRVRMPKWMRRSICRRCHIPLIPGVTARVRLRSQGCLAYKTVKCLNCGWIRRYPYRRRCRDGSLEEGAEEASREPRRYSGQERPDTRGNKGDQE